MCLMGEKRNTYRVWWGNLRGKEHLEDLGIYVKMDLEEAYLRVQTEFIMLRIGASGRLF